MDRGTLLAEFSNRFERRARLFTKAPGRVNILGEHTDYNDGFVFPAAIDRYLAIAADARDDNRVRAFPLSRATSVVVCDSRVQRSLDSSAYNQRRSECEQAVKDLGPVLGEIQALRDVTLEQLEEHQGLLDEVVYRRARHVISENERVIRGIEMLKRGDMASYGRLLYESHRSLRDDYEVSCPELDVLVELASEVRGTAGARMTGAGFGGCTVNLVRTESVEAFRLHLLEGYKSRTGRECAVYACRPSDGVRSWAAD